MKHLLITMGLLAALLALLVAPPYAGATPLKPAVITTWDPAPWGALAESVASTCTGLSMCP